MSDTPALLDRFYPIVPDAGWLARLAPHGIKTVQLRWKGDAGSITQQIGEAIAIAKAYGIDLIINDYWREAIELGARFVHIGQEDLSDADLGAIKAAGLRIGVSTHDHAELARALAIQPDYVALGPIWETKLKTMRFAPQGLARLSEWEKLAAPVPVVAIGGITLSRADGVVAHGARSAAVITDFITASDPELRIREWVAWSKGA